MQAFPLARQPPPPALELPVHRESESSPRGGERQLEVADVRHHQRSRCSGCRRPRVGCEVAERRVLLVPDRRDDRDTRRGDGAHDRLVAEREKILEAAATAREHDDVDVRVARELRQCRDDRARSALSLNARLADDDLRRREASADRRHEIASCCGVGSRQDPDRPWDAREPSLPVGREQPFGRELALELLEREEVSAEPEALDRRRPQTELCLLLVDLGAPRDVDGLALRELEREPVEGPPGDRHVERRARLRILQRQEDVRPRVVAPELGDLSLHPQRGQPPEVHPDPPVERRDREDLAVAVDEVLDLRHLASVSPVRPSAASARRRPPRPVAASAGRGRTGGRRAR